MDGAARYDGCAAGNISRRESHGHRGGGAGVGDRWEATGDSESRTDAAAADYHRSGDRGGRPGLLHGGGNHHGDRRTGGPLRRGAIAQWRAAGTGTGEYRSDGYVRDGGALPWVGDVYGLCGEREYKRRTWRRAG